jgi:hypothetical protein
MSADACPDGEPKEPSSGFAVIRVLAQPERRRRMEGMFEYLEHTGEQKIAEDRSQAILR